MNLVHVGVGMYVEFATHCLLGLRIIMRVFMAIHIRYWHTYRFNCTYDLHSPPIHLYYILVIDHMIPMCIMEVASRHLILLTSTSTYSCTIGLWLCLHHGTSPSLSSGSRRRWCWSVSSHWIRPGSCDPFTETYVWKSVETPLKSRYPTVWYILYDKDSCVFNAHDYISAYLWRLWEL